MTTTTTRTPSATERFDTNKFYRDYMSTHNHTFPKAIDYGNRTYFKCAQDIAGAPDYWTPSRKNWLAGVRAVELVVLGQATEVSL